MSTNTLTNNVCAARVPPQTELATVAAIERSTERRVLLTAPLRFTHSAFIKKYEGNAPPLDARAEVRACACACMCVCACIRACVHMHTYTHITHMHTATRAPAQVARISSNIVITAADGQATRGNGGEAYGCRVVVEGDAYALLNNVQIT